MFILQPNIKDGKSIFYKHFKGNKSCADWHIIGTKTSLSHPEDKIKAYNKVNNTKFTLSEMNTICAANKLGFLVKKKTTCKFKSIWINN